MNFVEEKNRIYLKNDAGAIVAEINFPIDNGAANICRTFVDDTLRGQGIADKLMQAALDKIKNDGMKIVPSCSYARIWFEKHPEESEFLVK